MIALLSTFVLLLIIANAVDKGPNPSRVVYIRAASCSQCYYCIGYFKSFNNPHLQLYKQLLCTCNPANCTRIIVRDKLMAVYTRNNISRL